MIGNGYLSLGQIIVVLLKLLIRKNVITKEEWETALSEETKAEWDRRHQF